MSRLTTYYFLLGLAQTAHSIEEMTTRLYDFFWIVTGRMHQLFTWFPQFRWNPDLFAAVNMLLIASMLGTVPFVEQRRRWALMFAGIWGIIEIINGMNHITASIVFRGYVPGVITAPLFLIIAPLFLRELKRSWRQNLARAGRYSST
jgi:hypothetical protein